MTEKHKRGFTLAELLVVVAIIAILVAVAIPLLLSSRQSAQEAACLSNITSAIHVIRYQELLDGTPLPDETIQNILSESLDVTPNSEGKYEGLCPAGGVYTIKRQEDDTVAVECNLHGLTGAELINSNPENIMNIFKSEKIQAYFEEKIYTNSLDSTGPNFGVGIKEDLQESLEIVGDFDFRIWKQKGGGEYRIYISEPLGEYDANHEPVMVTGYILKEVDGDWVITQKGSEQLVPVDGKYVGEIRINVLKTEGYQWD